MAATSLTTPSLTPSVSLPFSGELEGPFVRLVPLSPDHVDELKRIAFASVETFRWTSTPADEAQAERYFAAAFAEVAAGRAYVVTVLGRGGEVLGMSRITDVSQRRRHCELGYTWYRPEVFRTGVNTDCKLLLLRFSFEQLALVRVQLFTDTRNIRSQKAIAALGARFEGVARRHMVTKDGFIRDSLSYAITDIDWPQTRTLLEERLARHVAAAGLGG